MSSRRKKATLKASSEDESKPIKQENSNNLMTLRKRPNKPKHLTIKYDDTINTKKKKTDVTGDNYNNNPTQWSPRNWSQVYENIFKNRESVEGPVDEAKETNYFETKDTPAKRFHSLVGLMLSAQTHHTQTSLVMKQLKSKGLDVDYVLKHDETSLANQLKSINYHKTKAKNLIKVATILKEKFNCDVPDNMNDLLSLPGVGPKMALLTLQSAYGKVEGIAVDTHVHRIANLLGWVYKPTKNAEETRKQLESWVPKELWRNFNRNLVVFGQTICLPRSPKCSECPNNKLCPSAFTQTNEKTNC